jgi:hypothetical protein
MAEPVCRERHNVVILVHFCHFLEIGSPSMIWSLRRTDIVVRCHVCLSNHDSCSGAGGRGAWGSSPRRQRLHSRFRSWSPILFLPFCSATRLGPTVAACAISPARHVVSPRPRNPLRVSPPLALLAEPPRRVRERDCPIIKAPEAWERCADDLI